MKNCELRMKNCEFPIPNSYAFRKDGLICSLPQVSIICI
jgi:hypothetical protein